MTDTDPGNDTWRLAHREGGAGTPWYYGASALSNVSLSSSSLSLVHSYQPMGVFSQISYGTTVVCAADDDVDAAHTVSNPYTGAARE